MRARPNLLLITTDQQRFDTIAAAVRDRGAQAAQANLLTPHLDWLCATGIRYTRCYADAPVCAPSRATIMCGFHAWHHGLTSNAAQPNPLTGRPTLPGILTAAGYQTHLYGKAHFTPLRAHHGFEHMAILPDYYRWLARQPGAAPALRHGLGQNEIEPVFSSTAPHQTLTQWVTDRSIDFLDTRDPTRPFFLWTSYTKPHPPFDPSASCWQLYDGLDLPTPVRGDWADGGSRHRAFSRLSWHLNRAHEFPAGKLRAMRRAYYATLTEVDYALGRLFARLREQTLLENTWIIFTSDHGDMLGDHGLGAKSVFFEGSAHVPLLVRPPGLWTSDPRGGGTDDRLACLADLLPTFLALAGVDRPLDQPCDGLDLLGSERRARLFGECSEYHCLIEGDRKFHFSAAGGAKLAFDLIADPLEEHALRDGAPDLAATLAAHLAARGHPAGAGGRLTATGPTPEPGATMRTAWPGFHSADDSSSEMLH